MVSLICVLTFNTANSTQAEAAQWKRLSDATIGFSLLYPGEWSVDGQVIATEFSSGAVCCSVRMIDFEPPPDSGAAAPVEQSYVQVCAKPLELNDSLDQYMRRVYGESLDQIFVITDLNGTRAYQAKSQGRAQTIFAENQSGLVQIVTFVTAAPEQLPERQAQVETILGSVTLN
jgi:hypothetical protein